jgi:hypothetical protein
VWVYIPTKLSEDSNFKYKLGDPVRITLDTKTGDLEITKVSHEEAEKQGWARRERYRKK